VLWACAPAAAGPPLHPALPGEGLAGLDDACGVATDTEGNLYVPEQGGIRVFSPERDPLASIATANEPCGLALDGAGNLYASERATGDVVKYVPDEYPFAGAPAYAAPATVDASGEARGIAVDLFDDRLYVAKGDQVDFYNPDGSRGVDEVQVLSIDAPNGGAVEIGFEDWSETTSALPETSPAELQEGLEGLSTIGPGAVSVSGDASWRYAEFEITFVGPLGKQDLPLLLVDDFDLESNPDEEGYEEGYGSARTLVDGFDGQIRPQTEAGEDLFEEATGVAAYTYDNGDVGDHHIFVADAAGAAPDRVHLVRGTAFRWIEHERTLTGAAGEGFDFDPEGAPLSADQGACPPAEQACTAGHFFVPDPGSQAVYEFEAEGRLFAKLSLKGRGEEGARQPTAVAVDRSGGAGDGRLYALAGNGARLFAFGPVAPPDREARPDLSLVHPGACGVAVDAYGNRYVADGAAIHVYPTAGEAPLTAITGLQGACDVAVDSAGHVYALEEDFAPNAWSAPGRVTYFTPTSFPPEAGSGYAGPTVVATSAYVAGGSSWPLQAIGLDPVEDHVYATSLFRSMGFDSAANGSGVIRHSFAPRGVYYPYPSYNGDLAVVGGNPSIHLVKGAYVVHAEMDERALTQVSGAGSPGGAFGPLDLAPIAVDPASDHLLVFKAERGAWEEYEPSGTYVGSFGELGPAATRSGLVVDDGPFSPNRGTVYVAHDDASAGGPDVTAFGPLAYPDPPPRPPETPPVEPPAGPPLGGAGSGAGGGQGATSAPPAATPPRGVGTPKRCRPGQRRVRRAGKTVCVRKQVPRGKGPGRLGAAKAATRRSVR
jgi:hypothetical protein